MDILHTPFLKLQHRFTCIVAAPTKAGKTTFVSKLIFYAPQMISPAPRQIIWCYSEWQLAYEKFPQVTFQQGFEIEELRKCKETPTLIVLDDLMSEVKKDESTVELFTRGWSCNIIHITQDVFFDKS